MRFFILLFSLVQAELNQCHDKSCAGVYGGVAGMGGRQAILKEIIDAIVAPFTTTEENLTPNGLKNIMSTIIAPVLKSSPAFEGKDNKNFFSCSKNYLNCYFITCYLCISLIHTFVNIPALLLKNTLRFLIWVGILTKV